MKLIYLSLIAGAAAAVLPETHVVHERRDTSQGRFMKRSRVERSRVLPVRIGLTQSNLERGHEYLMEISDPRSSKYGRKWSPEEIVEAFKPSDKTVEAVTKWLSQEGFTNIKHSDNKGWIDFEASAAEVERLIHAEYFDHFDMNTGAISTACDQYHVPKAIKDHIDYITPGVNHLGSSRPGLTKPVRELKKRDSHQSKKQQRSSTTANGNLTNCDTNITPDCVAALYGIPQATRAHPNNSLGIYEDYLESYDQQDLDLFFSTYFPRIPNGTHPINNNIDGGIAENNITAAAGSEVTLDLDIAYPIVYPQTITIYNTNYNTSTGSVSLGLFNQFLDAIDASYCTYSAYGETGDDTEDYIDPIYPSTNPRPPGQAYNGTRMCGAFEATPVISVSYGLPEAHLPIAYQKRQCNEYLKLGLQGVSILFASGDTGVAARGSPACLGLEQNIFNPDGPSSCPYVTAVGATQVVAGNSVSDPESVAYNATYNYTSGGGFSNVFGIPDYQKAALEEYFDKHDPGYPYYSALAADAPNPTLPNATALAGNGTGVYNRIGRGYPDVSANGQNIATYDRGLYLQNDGTSASTPIFASIINRINTERMYAGKSSIGFLNPTLYAHPEMFNDITNGTNTGCGTNGFPAVPGWDPVTGLGTPKYDKMLEVFMALP